MPTDRYGDDMNGDEAEEELQQGLLDQEKVSTPKAKSQRLLLLAVLAVSVCLNLLLLGSLLFQGRYVSKASYENGFGSDLELVKSEIGLIKKPFFGGVELNEQGNFITNQDENKYIGKPSRKLDEEWEKLLLGLNINLSHEELDMSASTFKWPESGQYLSGLEVYHSLHCLNRLRQAIYIDHYKYIFTRPGDPSFQHHVNHCINHIRQALQCHADLTPMEWKLDNSKIILKADTLHTCRDWDKIHAWASSRQTNFEDIESWKNGTLVLVD